MPKTRSKSAAKPAAKQFQTISRYGRIPIFIYHLTSFCLYAYAVYAMGYDIKISGAKPNAKFGGNFKFLTYWNLLAQFVLATFNVICTGFNFDATRPICKVRDVLHHAIALPFGFFVALMFWGLYAVDRNLIFPKAMEAVIPPLLNHLMHTLVIITALTGELVCYHHRWKASIKVFLTFSLSYLTVLLGYYFYFNHWIYPVFEALNNVGRAVFITFCMLAQFAVYAALGYLHQLRWGKLIKQAKSKLK